MEKSWLMMALQTNKEYESKRKFVLQVRCSRPKKAVCDLETGLNSSLEMSEQCR